MNNQAISQAYLFIIFILNGILIGVIFDIFRILRRSFNTPNIVTYIEDVLFWVISALTVIYALFVFNNGEIRGFIFIGILLGTTLYMLFLSRTIVKVSVKVILFIKRIVYRIIEVLMYPLKIIVKVIYNIFSIPIRHFSKCFSKLRSKLNRIKSKDSKKLENKEGF